MGTSQREIGATVLGLSAILLYTALVLSSSKVDLIDFGRLFAQYLNGVFALWIAAGILALPCLLFIRRSRRESDPGPFALIRRWLLARWQRDRFLTLFWPPVLFALLMASFNAFKQMVLRDAGFVYDPLFAEIDRGLFFGTDPWRLTHGLLSSPWASYALDKAYHAWFVPMSLGVIICAFLADSSWRLRTQYLLSYIAIWILIGSVLAYLLPAAGPCFYSEFLGASPHFDPLLSRLAADQAALVLEMPGAQLVALNNQAGLLHAYGTKTLVVGGGISAMPSMHNALAVLFTITAFRIHRWAGWAMVAYAMLIWIGSIHLGLHYAIDGVAAALLTIAIWRVTGRIADWLEHAERRTPARTPVLAS